MEHKPTEKSFRTWNEEMVVKYDPEAFHASTNPLIRFIEDRRVEKILQTLEVSPSDLILEVGCGAGNILQQVECGQLFGTDISDLMLKNTVKRLGGKAKIFCSDAGFLPVKKELFDKVICTEVLEHVLSPSLVIKEIHRILRNGGQFILSVPNERLINRVKKMSFPLIRRWNRIHPGEYQVAERMEDEWHLHEFNLQAIKEYLNPYFRLKAIWGIPYKFLPLRYVIQAIENK